MVQGAQKQQEEHAAYEQRRQSQAATVLQRVFRGVRVRKAFACLQAVEEQVFGQPMQPSDALALLLSRSQNAVAREAEHSGLSSVEQAATAEDIAWHLRNASGMPKTGWSVAALLWLFDTQALSESDLDRVFRHHLLRQKNQSSKIVLHVVLMQHGDSVTLPVVGDTAREDTVSTKEREGTLRPEGWMQVTRTAWSLRQKPEHAPGLILTGSAPCCRETATRLQLVFDDGTLGASDSTCSIPPIEVCSALDFAAIGPRIHNIAWAAGAAVAQLPFHFDGNNPSSPVVALVAGGSAIESILACLCSGRPRDDLLVTGRLHGGDAVVLSSPPMMCIRASEDGEVIRPLQEIWHDALVRSQWMMNYQVHGDGRAPLTQVCAAEPSSLPLPCCETRSEWRRYAGEPLVMSGGEFSALCKRAGCPLMPLPVAATNALRPLVRDYQLPESTEDGCQHSETNIKQ